MALWGYSNSGATALPPLKIIPVWVGLMNYKVRRRDNKQNELIQFIHWLVVINVLKIEGEKARV